MGVAVWNWCALAYEDERNDREHSSELSKSNHDCAFVVLLDILTSYDLNTCLRNTQELGSQVPLVQSSVHVLHLTTRMCILSEPN